MLVMNIALDLRGGGGRRRQRGRRAELLAQIYRTFTSFERERFPGALPISTEYRRDRTGSDISVWWLKKLLSVVSSLRLVPSNIVMPLVLSGGDRLIAADF